MAAFAMRTILLVTAIFILATSVVIAAPQVDKASGTKVILSIVSDLEALAAQHGSHYPTGQVAKQIDRLMDRIPEIDQLERLAIICHSIAWPQAAEDVAHDGVFDCAMWRCVSRIAGRPGSGAASALQRLHPIIGPDGGSSLRMKEFIAAQAKITNRQ